MKRSARLILLACLLAAALPGCKKADSATPTATLGLTQVYQTVEAMLTQAYTQPPPSITPSITPTVKTSPTPRLPAATPTTAQEAVITLPPGEVGCNWAAAGNPIDVTIPDDTELLPGEAFTKIWKLENIGTCTWGTDYEAAFFYGEQMNAPASIALSGEVPPGQSIEVAIEMVAPKEPGTYQGNWKLRNASGELFGIGPNGSAPFWVRIVVIQIATQTPMPTPTPTATRTPTPTLTPTATPTPAGQARGTLRLFPADNIDLDTAIVNPLGGTDLEYQKGDFDWLVPQNEAAIGVYARVQPSREACQSASMSAAPVAVESLPQGIYLCYRTNQGLPGWMRLVEFNPTTFSLTLEVFTWAEP